MNMALSANFGRIMIFLAVFLQAIGKVMFGTWLTDIPSPLFVFISFALTAAMFLGLSRKGVGETAWGPLLLLNASTALRIAAPTGHRQRLSCARLWTAITRVRS